MPYDRYDPDLAYERAARGIESDHYGEEEYWTGYGSDDGYDAIKDANAEAGRSHNHSAGFYDARNNGWLRKVREPRKKIEEENE